jgi:hypothetical protein
MYIIYKHNLNEKYYIGYSSLTMEERLHKHYLNALSGIDTHFYRAIRKYGIDSIKSEILCECETQEQAIEKEKYYIEYYNTYKTGYNMTTGGDGGNICKLLPKEKYEKYIEKLIKRTTLDRNPNFSGYSDEEIVNLAIEFYIKNDNIFNIRKWQPYAKERGCPIMYSKNRFNGEGYVGLKKSMCKKLNLEKINEYVKTEEHKLKLSIKSKEWKWYTNGIDVIHLHISKDIPEGYVSGKILKNK